MFWHRLALALGDTVEELQERMSSTEFSRWIAYAAAEPFGYPMDNFRMGVPTAALVNAVRSTVPMKKGAHRPVAQPDDYFPAGKKRPPTLTREQQEFIRKKRQRKKMTQRKPDSKSGPRARGGDE